MSVIKEEPRSHSQITYVPVPTHNDNDMLARELERLLREKDRQLRKKDRKLERSKMTI